MLLPIRVVIVGCGAIGSSVVRRLQAYPQIRVTSVVVPASSMAEIRDELDVYSPAVDVLNTLPAELSDVDLLLECAGHAAIEMHVIPALQAGVRCIVASVGAASAPGMAERLEASAHAGNTSVELIAGAIGGIDALAAARLGGLEEVVYVGSKPALAWSGTPAEEQLELATLSRRTRIFEGSAREAAQLYPRNANVAATVSLAGLGLDHTQVELYADPAGTQNVHQIKARGAFGDFELTMRGKPLAANPKTSALTVYSAVRAVLNRALPVAI